MCSHRVKNWLLIWYTRVTIWPGECRKADDIFSFFAYFPTHWVSSANASLLCPLVEQPRIFRFHSASPNVLSESDSTFALAVLLLRSHISPYYATPLGAKGASQSSEGGRENTDAFNMQSSGQLVEEPSDENTCGSWGLASTIPATSGPASRTGTPINFPRSFLLFRSLADVLKLLRLARDCSSVCTRAELRAEDLEISASTFDLRFLRGTKRRACRGSVESGIIPFLLGKNGTVKAGNWVG